MPGYVDMTLSLSAAQIDNLLDDIIPCERRVVANHSFIPIMSDWRGVWCLYPNRTADYISYDFLRH